VKEEGAGAELEGCKLLRDVPVVPFHLSHVTPALHAVDGVHAHLAALGTCRAIDAPTCQTRGGGLFLFAKKRKG